MFGEKANGPKILGRYAPLVANSDHRFFKEIGVRTVFLHGGEDVHYHAPSDLTLQPELVQDTADFAVSLAREVIKAELKVDEPCGIGERDCWAARVCCET